MTETEFGDGGRSRLNWGQFRDRPPSPNSVSVTPLSPFPDATHINVHELRRVITHATRFHRKRRVPEHLETTAWHDDICRHAIHVQAVLGYAIAMAWSMALVSGDRYPETR